MLYIYNYNYIYIYIFIYLYIFVLVHIAHPGLSVLILQFSKLHKEACDGSLVEGLDFNAFQRVGSLET